MKFKFNLTSHSNYQLSLSLSHQINIFIDQNNLRFSPLLSSNDSLNREATTTVRVSLPEQPSVCLVQIVKKQLPLHESLVSGEKCHSNRRSSLITRQRILETETNFEAVLISSLRGRDRDKFQNFN